MNDGSTAADGRICERAANGKAQGAVPEKYEPSGVPKQTGSQDKCESGMCGSLLFCPWNGILRSIFKQYVEAGVEQ